MERSDVLFIDEIQSEWDCDFPARIKITECYISSIKYGYSHKPYYCVEMVFDIDSKYLNTVVYMSFRDLSKMLGKAKNFLPETLMEISANRHYLEVDGKISIRELYDTYIYCAGFYLKVIQIDLDDGNEPAIINHNVYSTSNFQEYLSAI